MSGVIINGRIESMSTPERAAVSEMSLLALKMIKDQQKKHEITDRAAASETTGNQAQRQGPDAIKGEA